MRASSGEDLVRPCSSDPTCPPQTRDGADRGPCAWCSAVGRGEEVRLGLFEPVAGQDEVCLFVEERDQAGDGWHRAAVRTGRYLLVVPLWGQAVTVPGPGARS